MKSKTVRFLRPLPISINFTGLHQIEWPLQASHTIDNTTQIWKFAWTTIRKLDAGTLLLALISSPVLAKKKSLSF